jgi:hypothetical protein
VKALRILSAALLVALPSMAIGARAAAVPSTPPALTLALVSQDLVVAPGGQASFTFTVSGTVPDNAEVVVEAYTKLASPQQDLARLINSQLHNRDVGFVALSLNLLTPDALGRYTVALPTVTAPQQRVLGGNALMPDAGMYPVTIELRSDNVALAQLVSAVVRTPDPAQAVPPLDVALVLPLGGTPTLRADGSTLVEAADRARLQTVANVLAASATAATVVPEPELIDGLSRTGLPADAALRTALAASIGARQVLASPYVTMDPTAVVRAGLGDELTRELTEGEDALAAAFGSATTDRATWVTDRNLDGDALGMLRDLGVHHLVVPARALAAPAGAPPPTATVTTAVDVGVAGDSLPVQAAAADPTLGAAFGRHDDPVLAAYQFAATLLAIGLDHPSTAARQGVVVLPPTDWQPDPTFLATVMSLVGQIPLLHAVTLDQWFHDVAVEPGGPRPLASTTPPDLSNFATGLVLTRVRLNGLASMLPAANPLPASLELRLRVASAASLAPAARQSYLDAVNGELNNLVNAVDPVPTRRITLASRTTEVPITLHRRIDGPIQVRLHLESPKLSFPQNDILVTLDNETVQERVGVQARANGTFPLTVRITTPEGDIAVAPSSELTVHATTLSGFGVVLTVGALLVLATWWVRHLRRTRRDKARAAGALHHPSAGPVTSQ